MSLGLAFGIATMAAFALSPVFYGLGARGIGAVKANAIRAIASLPTAYATYVVVEGEVLPAMGFGGFLWSFVLAVIGNVAGDTLFIHATKLVGPSTALAIGNTYALFTVAVSAALLGERVGRTSRRASPQS